MSDALDRLLLALDAQRGFDGFDEGLLWAALHAAGVTASWREAVIAAGGPAAVLERGVLPAFAVPQRRQRLLDKDGLTVRLRHLAPWLAVGGRVAGGVDELRRCADEPVVCFYAAGAGRLPSPETPAVAIVGSREADIGHVERTAALANALVDAGVVVVSGGAKGVDKAAQNAARLHRAPFVVVGGDLPQKQPVDVAIDPGLCWVTPFAPWEKPGAWNFAQRNNWIAALADVVIVVCGGEASGTRHTVEAAARLGRPIATVPVDADDRLGFIPRALLEHGIGHEVDDRDLDVDALLHLKPRVQALSAWRSLYRAPAARRRRDVPLALPLPLDGDEGPPLVRLLRLHGGELLIDEAASRLQKSMRELLVDAAALEMDGTLRREGALLCLVESR